MRQVEHKNGTKAWMVDARMNGKGKRHFFKSRPEADTKADQLKTARRNEGQAAFSIPEHLRIEAGRCAELLKPFGKTITEAVEFYLPHLQRMTRQRPLADLVIEAAAEKRANGLEKPTIVDFEHRCRQFVDAFPARDAASLSTDEIEQWLRQRYAHPTSRNNARKAVVNLFNFAVHKKYLPSNPAAAIKKAKVTNGEVGILKPSHVVALLHNSNPAILPYFAIAAFAGIRPEELQKMEWSDVRWKQGIIRVRAEISKVGASRNVHIEPNLAEWLQEYRSSDGLICPPNWRKLFRQTRIDARVGEWPADCLRHSFGTYWLEKHRNAPALALEMGNSVEVIMRHYYKVLDEPDDAERFWKITPAASGNKVVSLVEAA